MRRVFRYVPAVSALVFLVAACSSPQAARPAHSASSAPAVVRWHGLASDCPALPAPAAQAFGLLPAGKLSPNTAHPDEVQCLYTTGDPETLPTLLSTVKVAGKDADATLEKERSGARTNPEFVVEDVPGVGDAAFVMLEPDSAPRMSMMARSANALVTITIAFEPDAADSVTRLRSFKAQIPTLATIVNGLLSNLR
jgi:hypothetical protein